MADEVTFFAETNFRDQRRRFGIKTQDRRKHMYIIGKTGMGKTTLLENMAIQDIQAGRGVGIVDPHGEFAEKMLDFVPRERMEDVIYFNPADLKSPIAFNSMENIFPEQRHLIASGLLGVFKKIWPDVWSPRMEYLLSNAILALLEIPGSTLLGINRMFADKEFRKSIVSRLTDPVIRAFWEKEYGQYQERFATEASAAIQNKVGQFISNPLIRNIVGQEKSAVDVRKVMDEGKIFIMNLAKGKIGEENTRLLGAMLVTKLYLTAMTRVDMPEERRRDFYLYVDEFQNFATESFANILAEARKYRLDLVLAHQYLAQMDETVQDAVFGNVGTTVTFRVGAQDAEILEKEFSPEFMIPDLVNLGFAQTYLKLMIDGIASRPFSASTLAPFPKPQKTYKEDIMEFSRSHYGADAEAVRKKIEEFHGLSFTGAPPKEGPKEGARDLSVGPRADRRVEERKLYETRCIVDGATIMVPFMPDGKRPVYCEKHLEMFKKGELPPQVTRKTAAPAQRASVSHERTIRREDKFPNEKRIPPPPIRSHIESEPVLRVPKNTQSISLEALKPKQTAEEDGEAEPENREKTTSIKQTEVRHVKKEVNLDELRKVLTESLKSAPKANEGTEDAEPSRDATKAKKGGVIQPGQKITFE